MGKYGYSVYIGGISDRVRTGDVEDFFKGYGKILDISLKSKFGFIEFEDKYDAEDAIKDLDDTKLGGERVKLQLSKGCKDKYRDFRSSGRVRYRSFSREVSPSRGRYRSRSRSPRGGDRGGGGRGGGGYRERSRSRGRGGGRYDRDDSRRTFYDKPAYKKYGAPSKTKYSVEVDNLSSRCSWQDLKDFMRKAGEVTYGAAHDGEVGKNKGVVCYERKKDAERAIDDLDGRELNGRTVSLKLVIRDEWDEGSRSRSRSPRRSRSPPKRSRSKSRSKKRSRSRSRSERKDSRSRSRDKKSRSKSASRSRSRSRTPEKKSRRSRSRSRS